MLRPYALSFQGRRVLVIDKDLQVEAILVEKIERGLEGGIFDLLNIARGRVDREPRFLVGHFDRLDLGARTGSFDRVRHLFDCIV